MFSKKIENALTQQSYAPSLVISSVKFVELREFVDDGGSFLELARLNKGLAEALPGFEIRQINYSQILTGAIKATHIHKNQDDVWFVPSHCRLLAGLKDIRAGSKTEGVTMRIVLGAGKSRLLFIPRGVAHGIGNLWNEPATLIYMVNQVFAADSETCDEYRLTPDFFGKDFWKITHG